MILSRPWRQACLACFLASRHPSGVPRHLLPPLHPLLPDLFLVWLVIRLLIAPTSIRHAARVPSMHPLSVVSFSASRASILRFSSRIGGNTRLNRAIAFLLVPTYHFSRMH